MTWIAISGGPEPWVSARHFAPRRSQRSRYMPRGSLVLESRLTAAGAPQELLSYNRDHPWPGRISVQSIPGGGVALVVSQGDDVFHAVIEPDREERTDIVRITYSWDAPARWSRLAVERPEKGTVRMVEVANPLPIMVEDIYAMTRRPALTHRDPELVFFAVSNDIERLGPMATLSTSVPVETGGGLRLVGELKRGDTVRTRDAGLVPVLQTVERIVPALGSFQPVRLRAPYFGLTRDVVVAAHQRLVIGGSEVEYLFGREAVLIPALALVNNRAAVFETGHRLVRYRQLLLPGHAAFLTAGAALESLYIGRLRRHPDRQARTLLADFPSHSLPEHHRTFYQVLKPFEAITLAEARAA